MVFSHTYPPNVDWGTDFGLTFKQKITHTFDYFRAIVVSKGLMIDVCNSTRSTNSFASSFLLFAVFAAHNNQQLRPQ